MPITFAPPEPVSPSISTGYGGAEAYQQFAPTLARMQEATAGYAAQSGLAGQHANQQAMALAQQRTLLSQQEDARAQQQAQAGQQQQALQQQHFQQQLALQQTQLSQAERIHASQLQQADSWLDSQVAQGNYQANDPYVQEAKARVRGLLGPLQARQAQAQMQHVQAQTQELQEQAKMHAMQMKTFQDFAGQPNVVPLHDAEGNEVGQAVSMMGPDGKTHLNVFHPGKGGSGAGGTGGQDDAKLLKEFLQHTTSTDPVSGEKKTDLGKAIEAMKQYKQGVKQLEEDAMPGTAGDPGPDNPRGAVRAAFKQAKQAKDLPSQRAAEELDRILQIPKDQRNDAQNARGQALTNFLAQKSYWPREQADLKGAAQAIGQSIAGSRSALQQSEANLQSPEVAQRREMEERLVSKHLFEEWKRVHARNNEAEGQLWDAFKERFMSGLQKVGPYLP